MKLLGFLFLLFASVLASVKKANNETVIVLTTKNFGDTLKDSQFVVVYFHENTTKSSEWLSKTTPDDDFVSVAEKAKETLPGLKFAKLNTDEQKGYTTMFNITELPAIKMFSKGKSTPVSYDGDFTVSDILDWLKQRVDKNIPKLKTLDQLVFQIKNHTHLSLYLGSPLSEGYAEFLKASTLFISSNVGFAVTDEESIKKEVGADDDTLIVYRNHSEEVNHVNGPFTLNKIRTFVDGHIYPSMMKFNGMAKQRIFDEDRDAVFFIGNQPHFSGDAIEGFESVSQQFRDKIIFSAAIFTDPYGTALAEYLGVSAGELPAIVILHSNDKMTKYRLDQEVNFRNIGIFLLNFYHNNLVPYYKSSPYPIEEYDGDVKIVISKTFKEIVFDENHDVLIEFYSPKCSKCQAFAPHYSSIATRLTNIPNLIVAKIDGSMNDVEGVELGGFPSIRYYPRGKKQSPVVYSGEFTEKDVLDFVHKQVSEEV